MPKINRRIFLVSSLSTGLVAEPALSGGHQNLAFHGEETNAFEIANCGAIATEIARAQQEIDAFIVAPEITIEQEFIKLTQSLDLQAGELAAAHTATEKAIQSANAELKVNSIRAINSANDLLLATAVQTRNVNFIGAAVGVHVLTGTAVFSYQAVTAKNNSDTAGAIAVLANGRKTMVTILTTGPGTKLAEKQGKMAGKLIVSGFKIVKNLYTANELRNDLGLIKNDLEALEASQAGLPVNNAQMREFLINRLKAEKALYQMIEQAGGGDCKVDDPEIEPITGPIVIG